MPARPPSPHTTWPLLAPLTETERAELLASARPRRYERGETVMQEGGPGDSLHLVAAGRLVVRVSTPDGATAVLNVLRPGDYVGELALLRGEVPQRTATVVTLEPVETLSLSGREFHALCHRHPALERLLAGLLARRVEELSQRLLEALHVNVELRVHRRLLELVDVYADDDPVRDAVVIPLTQGTLADLAGATRPTVNQVLQDLAADGVVALGRGRIDVLDRVALRQRAHP